MIKKTTLQIHRALVLEIFGYTCIQLKTYLWWQLHSPPIWPLALWTKNREIPKRLTLRKVGRPKKLHKYLTSFCTSLLHWYQRKVKCKYRSQLFFNYLGVGYKTYKISPFFINSLPYYKLQQLLLFELDFAYDQTNAYASK